MLTFDYQTKSGKWSITVAVNRRSRSGKRGQTHVLEMVISGPNRKYGLVFYRGNAADIYSWFETSKVDQPLQLNNVYVFGKKSVSVRFNKVATRQGDIEPSGVEISINDQDKTFTITIPVRHFSVIKDIFKNYVLSFFDIETNRIYRSRSNFNASRGKTVADNSQAQIDESNLEISENSDEDNLDLLF